MKCFKILCMCISISMSYADTVDDKFHKMCAGCDGYQSLLFVCREIAKKYPSILCLGWGSKKLNKNKEICKVGGTLKLPIDLPDDKVEAEAEAYRVFFDIIDIYVSAMKKYKPMHHPVCKDFSDKNIRIHFIFCSSKGKKNFYPKIAGFIKNGNVLHTVCNYPKDHPKYTGPQLDPYTECIDYYELRKKYTNKSTRSNKEK